MSTSSKGTSARRAGFTLVEALVALVVAGLVLPALARALAAAWAADRAPMEAVSAMSLAGDMVAGAPVPPEARARGFAGERALLPATVLVLPSDVAPAPAGTGADEDASNLRPDATPAGIKLAPPKGAQPPPTAPPSLRRVAVTVRSPSGRRFALDALQLDDRGRAGVGSSF